MQRIIEDFWGAVVGILVGAIGWLVSKIVQMDARFNELHSANELLRSEIKHRDALRQQDRDDIADVKRDVREIRNAILEKNR